jgi:hypothetical protein
MSPIIEILLQAMLLVFAGWLIKRTYVANRKAKPHTLQSYRVEPSSREISNRLDAYFYAGGFVAGLVIIICLVLKLFDCGLVCGPGGW